MKARNTLLLLLIAAGFYFYLRYYESKKPTTQEAEEQNLHVAEIDQNKIDGITITNNEAKIELRKRNNQWEMDEPVKDRADDTAVSQLLSSVDSLQKQTTLKAESGKNDIRELGLAKSNITLQLLGQDAPPEILFGKDTVIEGKEYIRLGNSNDVFVVSNDLKNQVTKKPDDFRDHRLAEINPTQVNDVDIKSAEGEIELQKDHDHWQIDKPIKARGDDAKISDAISQTLNTRVDSFLATDQAATASTALNDARGTVTFTAEGTAKPVSLHLSKPFDKDGQKIYAKLSTREAVVILPKTADSILDSKPNDLRDRHLIRLNLDIVDRIHVEPAGAPEILLARKGEEWTIKSQNDKPANGGDVRKMAEALQNQLVTAFVSDVATDLPKYGLDQPQLKVTFSSFASQNTAETKAGEEPLETILFGKIDGDNIYAKLDDEPFIVSVPKTILNGIYADPLKWQDLAIYNLKPDDIVSLDVTRAGQAALPLVKEKGQWKPAKGDITLNTPNVESMVNTLATLRADRWEGATKPEQGLDTPSVTITFTTTDKKANSVKVGGQAGDYWYADATGADGTFVIAKTDHDSLTADILPVAKPAASALAPTTGASPSAPESSPEPSEAK